MILLIQLACAVFLGSMANTLAWRGISVIQARRERADLMLRLKQAFMGYGITGAGWDDETPVSRVTLPPLSSPPRKVVN